MDVLCAKEGNQELKSLSGAMKNETSWASVKWMEALSSCFWGRDTSETIEQDGIVLNHSHSYLSCSFWSLTFPQFHTNFVCFSYLFSSQAIYGFEQFSPFYTFHFDQFFIPQNKSPSSETKKQAAAEGGKQIDPLTREIKKLLTKRKRSKNLEHTQEQQNHSR